MPGSSVGIATGYGLDGPGIDYGLDGPGIDYGLDGPGIESTTKSLSVSVHSEIMPLAKDLLHPSPAEEKRKHKLKRLVQYPNSYFMNIKCPGCYKITTVFSYAQNVVVCAGCLTILCQTTGRRARLKKVAHLG
jgi:small subunit ribosomal protein S27e